MLQGSSETTPAYTVHTTIVAGLGTKTAQATMHCDRSTHFLQVESHTITVRYFYTEGKLCFTTHASSLC